MRSTIPRFRTLAGLAAVLVACGESPLESADEAELARAPGSNLGPPSNLVATAVLFRQIDLAWQDNSTKETGFEVHRSTTGPAGEFIVLATTGASVSSHADGNVSPLTEYCYKVRAVARNRSSELSGTACATTPRATPAAASNVSASPAHSAAVTIDWTDNSADEGGFRVERSTDGGATWSVVRSTAPNVRSANDFSVVAEGPLYCYRVMAFNGYGDADPSNEDCTTPPGRPTALTATVDGSAIVLAWLDNSMVEDGYEISRRVANGGSYLVIANVPANATTYRDVAAAPDLTHHYYVRATKDGGFSHSSNLVSAFVATGPPVAPAGVSATPWSTAIDVRWEDRSGNEDGFRVERSGDDGASWVIAGSVGINWTSFWDPGRIAEQRACYRVIATNVRGDSPPSTTACTTPPAVPTDLVATATEGPAIDLTWTDNSGVEDGYEVQRLGCYEYFGQYCDFFSGWDSGTERDELPRCGGQCFGNSHLPGSGTQEWRMVRSVERGISDDFPPATMIGEVMMPRRTLPCVAALLAACADAPVVPVSPPLSPEILAEYVVHTEYNVLSAAVVLRVTRADSALVHFHADGDEAEGDSVTPAVPVVGELATIPILGLLPSTRYVARVVAYGADGMAVGAPLTLITDALPPDLPRYAAGGPDPSPGYAVFAAGKYGVVIDNTGRVVWYRHFPNGAGLSFMAQPTGRYVVRPPTPDPADPEPWVELDILGNSTRALTCARGLQPRIHDVILRPGGSFWILCDETRTMDLTAHGGHANASVTATVVQHVGSSGALLFEWSAFEHFEIADLEPAERSSANVNWTHGNALDLASDGNLLVSFRNLGEITKIDVRTGAVIWRMGGRRNEFSFIGTSEPAFSRQHSVRMDPSGGILMLDNVGDLTESRAERYVVNEAARTARLDRSHSSVPGVITAIGGSVQPLAGDRTLVSFGTAGRVEEYDASGQIVWRIEGNAGYVFRAQRIASLYTPGAGMGHR